MPNQKKPMTIPIPTKVKSKTKIVAAILITAALSGLAAFLIYKYQFQPPKLVLVKKMKEWNYTSPMSVSFANVDRGKDTAQEIIVSHNNLPPAGGTTIEAKRFDNAVSPGFPASLPEAFVKLIRVDDVDKDENEEIVFTTESNLYMLKSDGSKFSEAWFPLDLPLPISEVAIGNVLGDKKSEIIVMASGKLFVANILGKFNELVSADVSGLGLVNFDDDNEKEIVYLEKKPEIIKIRLINGDGSEVKDQTSLDVSVNPEEALYSQFVLGDSDKDGDEDIIFSAFNKIQVWDEMKQDKLLDLIPQDDIEAETPNEGNGIEQIILANVLGDERPEIIFSAQLGKFNEPARKLYLYKHKEISGAGGEYPKKYELAWSLPYDNIILHLTSQDLNDDGLADIVFTKGSQIFALDGQGNSLPFWPINTLENARPIFGNFDNDSQVELLSVGSSKIQLWNIASEFQKIEWPMVGHDRKSTRAYGASF